MTEQLQAQSEKMQTIKKQKIDSLQALRAFAFLGIFCGHSGYGGLGAWGVSVFLVLSGFLMVYTYWDRPLNTSISASAKFAVKKIKKLYPLHLLVMLWATRTTALAIAKNFSFGALWGYVKGMWPQLLLVQAWNPHYSVYYGVNGVTWYLSVCLFLYFTFPFLLRQLKKLKSSKDAFKIMAAVLAAMTVVAFISTKITVPQEISTSIVHWVCYICPLFRLGDFAIGCCLGYVFLHHSEKTEVTRATALELETIILFVLTHMLHLACPAGDWWRLAIAYIPSSVAIVWLFAKNEGLITRLSANRLLVFIGNISPYTFLIHQQVIGPMQIYFYITLQKNISIYALSLRSFAVTAAIAAVYMLAQRCWDIIKSGAGYGKR